VAAAILVGSVAALVVNTLPVFLTVIARTRGFDERETGLIAFVDMGGIAVGTMMCALQPALVRRLGRPRLALLGLLILLGANVLASVVRPFPELLLARALAGVGAGLTEAVTYAILAEGDGARDLALFNILQLATGWLGVPLLPPLAQRFGVAGLFGAIACLAVLVMPLCRLLSRDHSAEPPAGRVDAPVGERVSPLGWMAILSTFLYFSSSGGLYAYLAFMGVAWGGAQATVEADLSTILFATMMGGVLAAFLGSRFGFRRPLYMGYLVQMTAMALLMTLRPVDHFLVLGCLFGFGWNIVGPYQFEAVTKIDGSSSAAMLVNAATLGGLAVGPAIAGYLATADFLHTNVFNLTAGLVSLAMIVTALRLHSVKGTAAR
jgi:predicted MFS family arabinose efflux permease